MISPSPTTKIAPTLARGILAARQKPGDAPQEPAPFDIAPPQPGTPPPG